MQGISYRCSMTQNDVADLYEPLLIFTFLFFPTATTWSWDQVRFRTRDSHWQISSSTQGLEVKLRKLSFSRCQALRSTGCACLFSHRCQWWPIYSSIECSCPYCILNNLCKINRCRNRISENPTFTYDKKSKQGGDRGNIPQHIKDHICNKSTANIILNSENLKSFFRDEEETRMFTFTT